MNLTSELRMRLLCEASDNPQGRFTESIQNNEEFVRREALI